MTREEKQKAIDALKISVPIMIMTEEKFNDYIQTLNKTMDWLEQEPTTKNDLGVDAVSRAEVLKLMQDNWHTHNGDWAMQESMDDIRALSSVTPQEPFKPMVEIDLYSVIKQKYIEREVLDKIRAEIAEYGSIMVAYAITKETKTDKGIEKLVSDVLKQAKEQVLDIIDKYKAEVEPQESEDKK